MIYLGADHRGFQLKEALKAHLNTRGIKYEDVGAHLHEPEDDYVDFAILVGGAVSQNPEEDKGIIICGSGHGMDMVVNKFPRVRAALVTDKERAIQSREHENANILVLPSDLIGESTAIGVVDAWLGTLFTGEPRHNRRLKKIEELEAKHFKI